MYVFVSRRGDPLIVYVVEHLCHALDVGGMDLLNPSSYRDSLRTAFNFDIIGDDMLVDGYLCIVVRQRV